MAITVPLREPADVAAQVASFEWFKRNHPDVLERVLRDIEKQGGDQ